MQKVNCLISRVLLSSHPPGNGSKQLQIIAFLDLAQFFSFTKINLIYLLVLMGGIKNNWSYLGGNLTNDSGEDYLVFYPVIGQMIVTTKHEKTCRLID